MSVLVNKDSKTHCSVLLVMVLGLNSSMLQMIEYGTNVVGGVTPGKGELPT
jgi:succinyl-CoA synthetase alpha subunit